MITVEKYFEIRKFSSDDHHIDIRSGSIDSVATDLLSIE